MIQIASLYMFHNVLTAPRLPKCNELSPPGTPEGDSCIRIGLTGKPNNPSGRGRGRGYLEPNQVNPRPGSDRIDHVDVPNSRNTNNPNSNQHNRSPPEKGLLFFMKQIVEFYLNVINHDSYLIKKSYNIIRITQYLFFFFLNRFTI